MIAALLIGTLTFQFQTAGEGIQLQTAGEGTQLRIAGDGIHLQIAGEGTELRTVGEGRARLSERTTQLSIIGCRRGQSHVQLQLLSVEEDRTDGRFKQTMFSTKSFAVTCYLMMSVSVIS